MYDRLGGLCLGSWDYFCNRLPDKMAAVTLRLPSLVSSILGVKRSIPLEAETFDEVVAQIKSDWPELAVHLFDESGDFREHVLCFLNESNSRSLGASNRSLRDGDEITILQAVSGG